MQESDLAGADGEREATFARGDDEAEVFIAEADGEREADETANKTAAQKIKELAQALRTAKTAFEGPHYSRMLLELDLRSSDEDFNECMDKILNAANEVYEDRYYVTGVPMSSYDIGNAFNGDLLKVNIITFTAILLIVTFSLRSFVLPIMLVFVIEGSIWITMGMSCIMGESIFFISYLICLSIQMGATIDYGILLCDQYRSFRKEGQNEDAALGEALRRAMPTILTSGIILVTAGYVAGKMCSVYYILSIGLLLSRGAFVSVVLVLTFLPALLTVGDRWIIHVKH